MEIVLATFGIAMLSLLGMFFFGEKGNIGKVQRFIVPFAIGAFLAIAFFELIPVTLALSSFDGSVAIVSGFLFFCLISNVLHTYHYSKQNTNDATRVSAWLLLWGDSIHNITDGVVVASAFLLNPAVGWVTALGVALREVPQEIAEFGVLRSVGYSRTKAGLLNFISASGIFVGAFFTLVFATHFREYVWLAMGFAAGNLLYVAAADLLPGVNRESYSRGTFVGPFVATLIGVVAVGAIIMYANMTFERDTYMHNAGIESYLRAQQYELHEDRINHEILDGDEHYLVH